MRAWALLILKSSYGASNGYIKGFRRVGHVTLPTIFTFAIE